MNEPDPPLRFSRMAKRGLCGRCPRCGEGRLFARYLKPVERCAVCGEMWSAIRADDGPAWLTILLVGHLLAPLLLWAAPNSSWPDWVLMTVFPAAALILSLVILPRAKGLFIAFIWHMRGMKA